MSREERSVAGRPSNHVDEIQSSEEPLLAETSTHLQSWYKGIGFRFSLLVVFVTALVATCSLRPWQLWRLQARSSNAAKAVKAVQFFNSNTKCSDLHEAAKGKWGRELRDEAKQWFDRRADCTASLGKFAFAHSGREVVACVGASITKGIYASPGHRYPEILQNLLGSGFRVLNFGVPSTTMIKSSSDSYWETPEFKMALKSAPSKVVILMGTNDAKNENWWSHKNEFIPNYGEMIRAFRRLPSKPQICMVSPPPVYTDGIYGINATVVNDKLPRLIENIGREHNVPVVDAFHKFASHCPRFLPNTCDWITDGVHPNDAGYLAIARVVRHELSTDGQHQHTSHLH